MVVRFHWLHAPDPTSISQVPSSNGATGEVVTNGDEAAVVSNGAAASEPGEGGTGWIHALHLYAWCTCKVRAKQGRCSMHAGAWCLCT